ncbi:hypothetical protein C8R45DRAFT_948387, partial [Mycena sanguinolenta]
MTGTLGISSLLRAGDKVQKCRSIVLSNGDLAETLQFMLYQDHGKSCVRRIEEILVEVETDSLVGLLISPCQLGPDVLPYRLPSGTVQGNQQCFVAFKNEVDHGVEPNDCIVNLAQLRSATDVQKLRNSTRFLDLSLVEAIEKSICNQEQLERKAKEAEEAKEVEQQEKAAEKQAKAAEKQAKVAQGARQTDRGIRLNSDISLVLVFKLIIGLSLIIGLHALQAGHNAGRWLSRHDGVQYGPPQGPLTCSDHRPGCLYQNENWGSGQLGNLQPQNRSQLWSTLMSSVPNMGSIKAGPKPLMPFARQLDSEDCVLMMFLCILCAEQQHKKVEARLTGIQNQLEGVVQFCTESWKPLEEQKKLLKSLLWHYIIRPITSYSNLIKIVESYILDHTRQLHLGLYRDDPTVKAVVHKLLMKENRALCSVMRKL